jgi:anti-sigma regulatory factor (Ser/Thr protein kinase)
MSGSTSRRTPFRPGVARAAGDRIGAAHGIWPLPSAGHPVQSQAPAPVPSPCCDGEHPPIEEGLPLALPSWARAFPGTAQQATAARRFVSGLLDGSPFRDDAVLVLSELFTNAILHSDSGKPGGLVIVQISRWLLGVRIAVTDQGSNNQPVIRGPGAFSDLAESGNGLYLAAQLAERLDWHNDASGRTIAAMFGRLPPERHLPPPATRPGESSSLPQPA